MNLNVVLRHELHELINHSSADKLYTALHAPNSPIRDRFIRFLALSYADWLSTQNDVDDENIKREWKHALRIPANQWMYPPPGNDQMDGTQRDMMVNGDNDKMHQANGHGGNQHVGPNGYSGRSMGHGSSAPNDPQMPRFRFEEKRPLERFLKLTDRAVPPPTKIDESASSATDLSSSSTINGSDANGSNGSTSNSNGSNDKGKDSISPPLTPKSDGIDIDGFENTANKNKKQFDQLCDAQKQLLKSKLQLLSDMTGQEQAKKNELLIKKLSLCAVNFDFNSTNPWELKGIDKKKQMLGEILDYIARFQWYSETVLQQCIKTISVNLFRALPRSNKNPEIEDEPFEDPAWTHLQLVYDLTLRLVINVDVDKKIMKKYLEGKFVDNVIELFASEDPREREYLKTILHRIYGRFMPLRALIRQSIANCCYRTIYQRTRSENGIAEFLEIFCSIIHGFSIPVKKEHKDFLRNVLVPLHKCRKLEKFHEQLVACCVQFVFKDPTVASVILGGLLKFWPVQSPTKEEMFIAEVVNVINAMINHKNGFSWPENKQICLAVIDKLVLCMKSNHHSVAERALLVWGEDAIEILIDLDKKTIWPKIVGAFLENKNHWNDSLKECNDEAMDVFRVRDHATFTKIKEEFQQRGTMVKEQQARDKQNRAAKWGRLHDIARRQKR